MDMFVAIICLVIGFVLLVKGADFFVDGASSIAKQLHIPAVVIGLTIVAFGTSAPELAVSVSAAMKGSNDIAIGNVVGSNIFNIFFILGVSGTILPMAVANTYLYDIAILIVVSIVFFIPICRKQRVSKGMGAAMVATYAAYMAYLFIR